MTMTPQKCSQGDVTTCASSTAAATPMRQVAGMPQQNASMDVDGRLIEDVGPFVQNRLGKTLRARFQELVRQPMPDNVRRVLEELQRQEKS